MGFCETCPRRAEAAGAGRDDVRGKAASSRGDAASALCIVGMAPGRDELEAGVPFVGASGRILAAALGAGNARLDDAFALNVINCYPGGVGALFKTSMSEVVSKAQRNACRARFESEMRSSRARAVLALGNEALEACTGLKGIMAWRGYVVTAEDAPKWCVPQSAPVLIPALHPAYVARTGLTTYPWLRKDTMRAVRASRGQLQMASIPPEAPSTPLAAPALAFDIETKGLGWSQLDRIGFAWRTP